MRIILIVSFLFIIIFSSIVNGQTIELICSGDDNFPPYSFEENNQLKGIDIDVLREITKRTGIKFSVELYPWKRLLNNTKKGLCDCSFSLFKTPERGAYAIFLAPVHYSTYGLFVRSDKLFNYKKLSDLYGKTIGKNFGFAISDDFDQAAKEGKIKIFEAEGTNKLIKLARHGIIDGFAGNINVTLYEMKKMGVSNELSFLPKMLTEKRAAYLVISKKTKKQINPEIQKQIIDMINEIHSDGTYLKIVQKYL